MAKTRRSPPPPGAGEALTSPAQARNQPTWPVAYPAATSSLESRFSIRSASTGNAFSASVPYTQSFAFWHLSYAGRVPVEFGPSKRSWTSKPIPSRGLWGRYRTWIALAITSPPGDWRATPCARIQKLTAIILGRKQLDLSLNVCEIQQAAVLSYDRLN